MAQALWDGFLQWIIQAIPSEAISGGIGVLLTLFIGKFLEHDFNKKLQIYTKDLNLNYMRKQQDFMLYTTKRHEIYLKLYKQISKAHSCVLHLRSYRKKPDYKYSTKEEIAQWCDENDIPKKKRKCILDDWDADRKSAVKKIQSEWTQKTARNALIKAHHITLDNQLYISDNVLKAVVPLIENIRKLIMKDKASESAEMKQEIQKQLGDLTTSMKTELQQGYYDEAGKDHRKV